MDGFLAKPIDEAQLHYQLSRAIERQLQRGIELAPMQPAGPSVAELDAMFGIAEPHLAPPPAPPTPSPEDRAAALQLRMRAAFAADLPRRRAELRAALETGDMESCARVLHGLRGSAAHLGASELVALCAELEAAAERGLQAGILAALPALEAMLGTFERLPA
jgi:HPt (histidine-containing phosphotransfer) domain-containing protein